jgi:hypothetical protein
MKGFSFFEVEKQFETLVFQSFSRNIKHDGTLVKVELSNDKPGGARKQGYSGKKDWNDKSKGPKAYSGYKKKEGQWSADKDFSRASKKKHRKGSNSGR